MSDWSGGIPRKLLDSVAYLIGLGLVIYGSVHSGAQIAIGAGMGLIAAPVIVKKKDDADDA